MLITWEELRNHEIKNFEIHSELNEDVEWGKQLEISFTYNGSQISSFVINNKEEYIAFLDELLKYSANDFTY